MLRGIEKIRATFAICLFVLLGNAAAQAQVLSSDKAFVMSPSREASGRLVVRWHIAQGYYLYRDHIRVIDAVNNTPLEAELPMGVTKVDPDYGATVVYTRDFVVGIDAPMEGRIRLEYQGCKENSICYPFVTKLIDLRTLFVADPPADARSPADVSVGVPADPAFRIAGDEGASLVARLLSSGGPAWVMASFFAFGLLLAFTPCVLPMYPILAATLARSGSELSALRGGALSAVYVVAMASAFAVLGVVAASSGQNLQIVLQSPFAICGMAVLFLLLSASMFGLFELQLPSAWVNKVAGLQGGFRGSVGSTAFLGFTSALIVSPCVTAPLAAALIYIAQTGNVALGAASLFALGLGQGLPLIAAGAFGAKLLPKAGAWMTWVKRVFGVVFIGVAIWMLDRIVPPSVTLVCCAALLIVLAGFLKRMDDRTVGRLGKFGPTRAVALLSFVYGLALLTGAAGGSTDPLRPLSFLTDGSEESHGAKAEFRVIDTDAKLDGELRQSSASNAATIVYVTADWCVTCRAVEKDVLSNASVVQASKDTHRLKIDLSRPGAESDRLVQRLGVVGPPTMIFFNRTGNEIPGSRLVGDVKRDEVLATLKIGSN